MPSPSLSMRWTSTSSVVADLEVGDVDAGRELASGDDAFGLAADVDEQFVVGFGDDEAGEHLTLVEDLQAFFVQTLVERELVVDRPRLGVRGHEYRTLREYHLCFARLSGCVGRDV